jgi:hypothetical protein
MGVNRETGEVKFYGNDELTSTEAISRLMCGVQVGVGEDIYDRGIFSEEGGQVYRLVGVEMAWDTGMDLYTLGCIDNTVDIYAIRIYRDVAEDKFYLDSTEQERAASEAWVNDKLESKQNVIPDLGTIRSQAAAAAPASTVYTKEQTDVKLAEKQDVISDLGTIRSQAAAAAPASTVYTKAQTDGALDELKESIEGEVEDGTVVAGMAKLAENIASWADRKGLSVDNTFTDVVRTAAGDASIDSSQQAKLISIFAKTDFSATVLKATGFNLLHGAAQVGSGYYFLVPALPFGTYGTAEKPNGVLFTNGSGANLQPTVRFKALGSGVPTSVSDGTAITPITAGGLNFYTTSQPGYMIVSGITLANTCAHIAWSRRYDEFISPTDASDAGSNIALTAIINAVHSYGLLLSIAGGPSDGIIFGDAAATWYRYCDRVKPTWTNEEQEEAGTYLHTATISGMKSGGAVECSGIQLNVDGTTISYTDNNASATTEWVKYELAAVATGTATISPLISVEDWGLEELIGATGTAYVTMQYAQNYPDALAALASTLHSWNIRVLVEAVAWLDARCKALESMVDNAGDLKARNVDSENMPMVCGYSMVIEGAGAPSVVPRFVGQIYIDTTNRKVYLATRVTNATSDWTLLN